MKEQLDWERCKEKTLAKKISPDIELAQSLQESAKNRRETVLLLPFNEITKETIISLWYDVLRELLESMTILGGYKIYNHECYTYFLRSVLLETEIAADFNSLRMLRNAINYYGRKVALAEARLAIQSCELLIKKIETLLKRRENKKESSFFNVKLK